MRHLAAAIAMSSWGPRNTAADDRRRAEAWRELHRRPDALPDPVEAAQPVPVYRRFRVTSFAIHRRHAAGDVG